MDNLTTMTLTDELAAKQDEIISGEEKLNLSKIYDEINSLEVLAKPIQDYFEMTQDEYYNSESDGKLNLLQLNEKLGSLNDRILTNHVDGYVDKGEVNFTYNHENPTIDGLYDRKTDFNVLLYSLKVIGAVRAIAPDELKKVLSKDAVLSLGLAAHALENN